MISGVFNKLWVSEDLRQINYFIDIYRLIMFEKHGSNHHWNWPCLHALLFQLTVCSS